MKQISRKDEARKFCRKWILLGLLFLVPVMAQAQAIYIDENTRQRAHAFESLFFTAARQHSIDARLLWVIAYLESRFRPQAVSAKGARGLMQLMPATAVRWGVQNPYEPKQAITGAARYVRYLEQRFAGRSDLTLAAYNAGETAVAAYRAGRVIRVGRKLINPAGRKTDGVPPYRETRAYVSKGVALLQQFTDSSKTTSREENVPDIRAVQQEGDATRTAATINRKSIIYAPNAIPPAQPLTTATLPRSISYVSR